MATRSRPDTAVATAAPRTSFARAGPVAGAGAAVAFALLHAVLISDIWLTLPIMVPAGAACGLAIGWSYGRMVDAPSWWSWLAYITTYVAMFFLLGAASVLVFEPVTTVAALVEANEPASDLIATALPMTIAFTLAAAVLVGALFGRSPSDYLAALATCSVLVVFLGLNVSIIGLVAIPHGDLYLVAELFGLIVFLGAAFAAGFAALERRCLLGR